MLVRALVRFVWVAGLWACSAPARPMELTWAQCRDGIDNDLDGLADCLDSDCRAVPCVDAGIEDSGIDAGVDASEDAQTDAPANTCSPACAPGEVCVDQHCQIALPATFEIEVLSMDGPGASALPLCFDATFQAGCEVPDCLECPPDPYVQVAVAAPRPGGGTPIVEIVGRTVTAHDMDSATWNDGAPWQKAPAALPLTADHELQLSAWDEDSGGVNPDDLMFACSIPAPVLRIGAQRCFTTRSQPAQSPKAEFDIWINVRPAPARN